MKPVKTSEELSLTLDRKVNEFLDEHFIIFRKADYEKAKTLYGRPHVLNSFIWEEKKHTDSTHQTKTVCIEPIKECEHPLDKIVSTQKQKGTTKVVDVDICLNCGEEVEPIGWKVKDE